MIVEVGVGVGGGLEDGSALHADNVIISTTRVNATTSFDCFFIISCILSDSPCLLGRLLYPFYNETIFPEKLTAYCHDRRNPASPHYL